MYNFNQTSLSTPPLLGVGVDFCTSTPRTPEILNSLIAMTNPFEYSYSQHTSQQSQVIPMSSLSMSPIFDHSPVMPCKMESTDGFMLHQYDTNSQSNCSSSSSLESPGTTPLHMSSTLSSSTTPSLQQVSVKWLFVIALDVSFRGAVKCRFFVEHTNTPDKEIAKPCWSL